MPEVARVLRFRPKEASVARSREEADSRAAAFLIAPEAASCERTLSDADALTAICARLTRLVNSDPSVAAEKAHEVYRFLTGTQASDFFFDERDFFLGESALLTAGALRLLGKSEETERWLDRAEANFRHTVSPAPHLARVAYNRLTLRYQTRRYEEVLELLPSVALTFEKLGMTADWAKCQFLEAMSLKDLGRIDEAAGKLESLALHETMAVDAALRGMALVNLGDLRSGAGLFEPALSAYREAMPLLEGAGRLYALADLKAMVGGTLRQMGQMGAALEAYRNAVKDFADLGMATREAYFRILFAELLLEAGKAREAEWEILAALPTIDQEKLVPEGFAAAALLRESVRQRKTDPNALLEVRTYLEARS